MPVLWVAKQKEAKEPNRDFSSLTVLRRRKKKKNGVEGLVNIPDFQLRPLKRYALVCKGKTEMDQCLQTLKHSLESS